MTWTAFAILAMFTFGAGKWYFHLKKSVDFVNTNFEITLMEKLYLRILYAEKYTTFGCDCRDDHLTWHSKRSAMRISIIGVIINHTCIFPPLPFLWCLQHIVTRESQPHKLPNMIRKLWTILIFVPSSWLGVWVEPPKDVDSCIGFFQTWGPFGPGAVRIREGFKKGNSIWHLPYMGPEHASREKILSMLIFFIFVHKTVYRIRFQQIKIRS